MTSIEPASTPAAAIDPLSGNAADGDGLADGDKLTEIDSLDDGETELDGLWLALGLLDSDTEGENETEDDGLGDSEADSLADGD